MSKCPKLAAQWKIIHDFKATNYFHAYVCKAAMKVDEEFKTISVGLLPSYVGFIAEDNNLLLNLAATLRGPPPAVGKWTRIEVSHEEEDGKYFLSLAVGDAEVVKQEVTDLDLRNLSGVKIMFGGLKISQPGCV